MTLATEQPVALRVDAEISRELAGMHGGDSEMAIGWGTMP
jgi:hypothetical protein